MEPEVAVTSAAAYLGSLIMSSRMSEILGSAVCFGIGLVLWRTMDGVEWPVITPSKVGVVLMFVGGLGAVWALVGPSKR